MSEKPPLALWLHYRATDERLPRDAVRQLIEHYTEPGDLILTDTHEQATQARRLNRRARPTSTAPAAGNVRELPQQPAQLGVAKDVASAAAIAASLAPGGFLVVDVTPPTQLGALARELEATGLQYWQHIVLADTDQLKPRSQQRSRQVELERAHRDLLVFRQPASTAVAAAAGPVWAEMVAA